jgi:hypothetical protein
MGRKRRSCLAMRGTAFLACLLLAACHSVSFQPAPVVPTKQPLPYSARIRLADLAAYAVEPGATMGTDPRLPNFVTPGASVPSLSQKDWETAVLDYVTARQTFRRVTDNGPADIALILRMFIYIDPGLSIDYNHIYVARAEATITDPHNGRPLTQYTGLGKAVGPVSRGSKEEDQPPINKSVQAALNDLFDKMESDTRLAAL